MASAGDCSVMTRTPMTHSRSSLNAEKPSQPPHESGKFHRARPRASSLNSQVRAKTHQRSADATRDSERRGRFGRRQAGEETQLHQFGLGWLLGRESGQGFIECQQSSGDCVMLAPDLEEARAVFRRHGGSPACGGPRRPEFVAWPPQPRRKSGRDGPNYALVHLQPVEGRPREPGRSVPTSAPASPGLDAGRPDRRNSSYTSGSNCAAACGSPASMA